MAYRFFGRTALALACLSTVFLASAEATDFVGPPSHSVNGCPANEDWTFEVVARALNVSERAVRRAKSKMGLDPLALCTRDRKSLETILEELGAPKRGFDEPDKAMEFRQLSYKSDDGRVVPGGLRLAYEQRQRAIGRPKAGGLTPGTPFWTEIGPFNVGGRVRAVLPLTTTRILVGSVSGGLFLTENAGASWAPVRDLMPNVAISCLHADPVDSSIIYVCTGEGTFNIDYVQGDGIYRITGANLAPSAWTITRLSGTNPGTGSQWYAVNRLVVLPNPADPANVNNRVIVAATNSGIWRSANGGASFSMVTGSAPVGYFGTAGYLDLRVHPLDWSKLVAGERTYCIFPVAGGNCVLQGGSIVFSLDGGINWSRRTLAGSGRVEVTPIAGVGGGWLALLENTTLIPGDPNSRSYGGQLFRSMDNGNSWIRRDTSGLDNLTPAGSVLGAQAWYDMAVWASPDGSRVMAGGVGIRLSIDGGVTFGAPPCGAGQVYTSCPVYAGGLYNIHPDHHAIVSSVDYATSGIVYFGQDGGVYRANIAAQTSNLPGSPFTAGIFTSLNNNLGITQFYGGDGATFPGNVVRITGGTQDNGSWTWDGTTWRSFNGGDGGEGGVDRTNPQYVYGEHQWGIVYRSTNGGDGTSPPYPTYICQGILDTSCDNGVSTLRINFIPHFILDPNNSDRMLVGGESLWRSNNVRSSAPGIPTWTAIKGPQLTRFCQTNFCSSTTRISFIAVAPGNSDIAWVGYNDGQIFKTSNATAGSPAWSPIAFTGLGATPQRMIMRILIDPSNSQRVWVGLGGYNAGNVIRTVDGGNNWVDVQGNLPQAPVRALARHPTVPDTIYAGTEVGVFASDSAGVTWSTTNEGPGTVSVEELFFLDSTTLIASTHGRGMFKATISSPGAGDDYPDDFGLAPSIGLNSSTPAMLSHTSDVDWFRFDFPGRGQWTIQSSGNVDVVGFAYATDGTTLYGSNDDGAGYPNFRMTFPIGAATSVLVKVMGVSSNTTGAYTLVSSFIPDDFPDNPLAATPVGINSSTPAAINFAGDPDWFQFQFPGPGVWTIRTTGTTDTVGTAYAPDGVTVYATDNNTEAPNFRIILPIGAATTVLLKVTGSVGSYTLQSTFTVEDDPNVYSQARALPLNSTTAANLYAADDVDWFRFDFPSAGTWVVKSTGSTDVIGTAFAPNGTTVYGSSDNVEGVNFRLYFQIGAPTWVLLRVTGRAAGNYSVVSTFIPAGSGPPGGTDFNLDGKSDILWRNEGTGQVYRMQMNGLEITRGAMMIQEPNLDWRIVGDADFDGGGTADLLWHNRVSKAVSAALVNSNGVIFQVGSVTQPSDPAWRIVGTPDFDDDGRADLLWWNASTGMAWGSLLNGSTIIGESFIWQEPDLNWKIVAVGDFTGSGKKNQLLWRNSSSGHVYLMRATWAGGYFAVDGWEIYRESNLAWQIVGVADFNGDFTDDLLWRNNSTGQIYVMLINGGQVGNGSTVWRETNPAWKIVANGDYNGDGRADILWRNDTTGQVFLMLMNGLSVLESRQIYTEPNLAWKILGPPAYSGAW